MNCEKLSNPSMDKKKKLKHTVNRAKEQSTMEKKNQNDKSKSILEILPLELIHRILLRVPIRHLARLRCVSKLWCSLISDPDFAELHFHHSPAATNACFFMKSATLAYVVYLDDNDASQKVVSPPFKKKPPSHFNVLGACRGFILLHRHPHLFVVWNPLTGSSKKISYSRIVPCRKYHGFRLPYSARLHGFGYDASQDDYLVVAAWRNYESQEDHLECFSLRTNSWINLNAALPNPLDWFDHNSCGLFLNGAIHWVPLRLKAYRDAILIFDLKERTFSSLSGPEQPVKRACSYSSLALLGGCLALYYRNYDSHKSEIWVMKEYKMHSSWTLYQIPCKGFQPLCLSSNGDIIGRDYNKIGYFIYNVRGDLLKHFKNVRSPHPIGYCVYSVYRESLAVLPLPSHIKNKDKKRKENSHQGHHQV